MFKCFIKDGFSVEFFSTASWRLLGGITMKRVCFLTRTVIRGGHPVSSGPSPHREADLLAFLFFHLKRFDFTSGKKEVSENRFLSS